MSQLITSQKAPDFYDSSLPMTSFFAVKEYFNDGIPEDLVCRNTPLFNFLLSKGFIEQKGGYLNDFNLRAKLGRGSVLRTRRGCEPMVCDSEDAYLEGKEVFGNFYYGWDFCADDARAFCNTDMFNAVEDSLNTTHLAAARDVAAIVSGGTEIIHHVDPADPQKRNFLYKLEPGTTPMGLPDLIGNGVINPTLHNINSARWDVWRSKIYGVGRDANGLPKEIEVAADIPTEDDAIPLNIEDIRWVMSRGYCGVGTYDLIVVGPELFFGIQKLIGQCGLICEVNNDLVKYGWARNVVLEGATVVCDEFWGIVKPGSIGFFNTEYLRLRVPEDNWFAKTGPWMDPSTRKTCLNVTLSMQLLTLNRGSMGELLCRKPCP